MEDIEIKRIYAEPSSEDGIRILVDRLWPRGMSKEKAKVDLWYKEIAPSQELRKQFCHVPERFEAFKHAYESELEDSENKQDLAADILRRAEKGRVTLLYGSKDPEHNQAVVLREWLLKKAGKADGTL